MVETGLGVASGFPDGDYEAADADVVRDIASALVSSEVVLRVRRPAEEDLEFLAEGTLHISPFSIPSTRDRSSRNSPPAA